MRVGKACIPTGFTQKFIYPFVTITYSPTSKIQIPPHLHFTYCSSALAILSLLIDCSIILLTFFFFTVFTFSKYSHFPSLSPQIPPSQSNIILSVFLLHSYSLFLTHPLQLLFQYYTLSSLDFLSPPIPVYSFPSCFSLRSLCAPDIPMLSIQLCLFSF